MEGAGSRLGRASSRFGPVSSTSMFTGPVRKWKRQWKSCHGGPSLLLPRWTPLSSDSVNQPKRKFRYTPVVELKQKKIEAEKEADVEGNVNQSTPGDTQNTNDDFGKLNVDDVMMKQVQEMTNDMLPSTEKNDKVDLFGKSHTEDSHLSGHDDETLRAQSRDDSL